MATATKSRSAPSTNGTAVAKAKDAAGAITTVAGSAKGAALAAGAAAAGLAGGVALGAHLGTRRKGLRGLVARRPRVLGVPLGRKTGLHRTVETARKGNAGARLGHAAGLNGHRRDPSGARAAPPGEPPLTCRGRARRADAPARRPQGRVLDEARAGSGGDPGVKAADRIAERRARRRSKSRPQDVGPAPARVPAP